MDQPWHKVTAVEAKLVPPPPTPIPRTQPRRVPPLTTDWLRSTWWIMRPRKMGTKDTMLLRCYGFYL